MKCGIKEVSELTGVSARTLRYYDQIGLLKPSKTSEAGYRYYGERELEILQQILFYKERGMELKQIKKTLTLWRLCGNTFWNLRKRETIWKL